MSTPAAERLERILYVLPAATRPGGARIADLASTLGVGEEEVGRDIVEVMDRAHYQPPGEGDRIQLWLDGDRVRAWTKAEFQRPIRLAPAEAVALSLGLRELALSTAADREPRSELAHRLEADLARGAGSARGKGAVAVESPDERSGSIRASLEEAVRTRRRCRIRYLKPSAADPEERDLEPYVLVYSSGDGAWYVVGRSPERDAVRTFRVDRVLSVEVGGDEFEMPRDFEAAGYVTGGRVYESGDEIEAVVRYSPRIARWIEEKGVGETQPDGSVVARHPVADPDWLVRHVLQYAPEAEVLAPEELRERVRAVAAEVVEAAG